MNQRVLRHDYKTIKAGTIIFFSMSNLIECSNLDLEWNKKSKQMFKILIPLLLIRPQGTKGGLQIQEKPKNSIFRFQMRPWSKLFIRTEFSLMKVALQCPKPEWVFLASIDSFTFYCIEAKVAKKIENNYINIEVLLYSVLRVIEDLRSLLSCRRLCLLSSVCALSARKSQNLDA